MNFPNLAIRQANGYKNGTSKERALISLADGTCEGCRQPIIKNEHMVRWNRKFGVFHSACFGHASAGAALTGDGLAAEQVTRMIQDAMQAQRAPIAQFDETKLVALVAQEIAKRVRPDELRVTRKEGTKDVSVKIKHAHVMLKKVIAVTQMNRHSYLYGPPGSGKSTLAMHAAKALGRKYGYVSLNAQSPESRLIGFKDANGKYNETMLFTLYKSGGVFCIDELDNAAPGLLTTLNSLLENGIGAFPCGMIERHPDFVLIATGNTAGRGGNMQFPERRAFDAAFAERFTFLFVDYDETMERAAAIVINAKASAWVEWVQAVRKFAKQHDPRLVVSPRATFAIAEYLTIADSPFTTLEMLDAVLFKGIEVERVNRIVNANPLPAAA